jgi:hypothetical protein
LPLIEWWLNDLKYRENANAIALMADKGTPTLSRGRMRLEAEPELRKMWPGQDVRLEMVDAFMV